MMNFKNYSIDEIEKWCLLRGMEWGAWPLFVTQPLIPILFLWFEWWKVIVAVVILSWVWTIIRYQFVSYKLAWLGVYFVFLKWFIALGVGIFFILKGQYFLGTISISYPIIVLILMFLIPATKIGVLQKKFMADIMSKSIN